MYGGYNISFGVEAKPILSDVSIELAPGKVTAIVGPNGAGKSTFLKILAGEMRGQSGIVKLDDKELKQWSAPALAKRRAVLPQSVVVAFPFLAREIVALGLPQYFSRVEGERLIACALHTVDLTHFGERVYDTLSGGERQRIQLARVLVQLWAQGGSGYLLLDEPTSSLDLPHQLATLRIARDYAAQGGGVLAVLHDINLAIMAADEIVALKEGRVIASGSPASVVTDDLIRRLYDVNARVRGVPDGPFLLPQTIASQNAGSIV
jgi:iron complex transport system ATP-binding protein